jgi:ABC-2 type transport system ATP-binding protein
MGNIIEVSNVFKTYGTKKVLEKLSFSIEEGKLTTLIGCNGAGKSTTLRLIAGIEGVDSGSVKLFGQNPHAFDFKHRPDTFFIHENMEMTFPVNLLEMVSIYRKIYPRWSNDIFNQILKHRKFSIKKQFSELSRGQKMQFMLMMALASQSKILLLDEITAVIDIEGQRYFLEQLKDFTRRGGTVVITTNILSELNEYADHLLLLQETKLRVDSSIADLKKKFIMLKKLENHPVFQHPEAALIRKDESGVELYLIPRHVVDEDTAILRFKYEHTPRFEDILVLYFQLKNEKFNEKLEVA